MCRRRDRGAYEPDLLPPIRYLGDHQGVEGFTRDADAERRWQELLASAEALFGLPGDSPAGLATVSRCNQQLRWVQHAAGARAWGDRDRGRTFGKLFY